ncbi:MAG TPA: nucleoside transporter C-terminal domain-containing protein [Terriglobales bacterium]|jgi:CNT family concentrative nucleoside transporter|nr:nucleoside transporter C-terminal domain-containing protein [Terriglobales bacterium]
MGRFTGILGLLTMLGLAYAFSTNRRAIRLKTVAWGLGLQAAFAVFVLRSDFGRTLFQKAGDAVSRLLGYAFVGSQFVFGDLGKQGSQLGFYFAFQVLPTVIFICALFAVLYYIGVMQLVIKGAAWLMTRLMGVSGAESLNVAASIFMGQTEAPQTIRPFLPDLTYSELMTVMTSGMAHVSGSIMAAYIAFGIEPKHLLSAVIMTAPGTLLMAKMLVPETEVPKTAGRVVMSNEEVELEKNENLLGAIARGTTDGLHMALNIAAMLISFLALIALLDGIMGGIHAHIAWFPSSLEAILGALFAPIAWVIGVPWHDCHLIGNLLGIRMVLNELVAFKMLGPQKAVLDPRSFTIATFALCGFANFSSIGIQMGGIGALAPNKKADLARLGIRAMLAGTMANLMSASIAGMLL